VDFAGVDLFNAVLSSVSSSYQTIAGMSSYLTTAMAVATYQVINNAIFTGNTTFSSFQNVFAGSSTQPLYGLVRGTKTGYSGDSNININLLAGGAAHTFGVPNQTNANATLICRLAPSAGYPFFGHPDVEVVFLVSYCKGNSLYVWPVPFAGYGAYSWVLTASGSTGVTASCSISGGPTAHTIYWNYLFDNDYLQ